MNEFLELVTQRPDYSLTMEHECPYCCSDNILDQGYETTLLGGGGNHRWYHCKCNNCNETFVHEIKENYGHTEEEQLNGARHWYTKDNKVLKGIPACVESYIYTCKHCGGDVQREYINNDGNNTTCITYIGGKIQQKIIFKCINCNMSVESTNDHFLDKEELYLNEENLLDKTRREVFLQAAEHLKHIPGDLLGVSPLVFLRDSFRALAQDPNACKACNKNKNK